MTAEYLGQMFTIEALTEHRRIPGSASNPNRAKGDLGTLKLAFAKCHAGDPRG